MSDLHALVSGFADVADAYERGRPAYAPAAVAAIAEDMGAAAGARVLDLGAGTGKLSRPLLAAGFDVVAVEPLPGMLGALRESIGADRVHEAAPRRCRSRTPRSTPPCAATRSTGSTPSAPPPSCGASCARAAASSAAG